MAITTSNSIKVKWLAGKGEKLLFTGKEVFPLSPHPSPFFKKSGVLFGKTQDFLRLDIWNGTFILYLSLYADNNIVTDNCFYADNLLQNRLKKNSLNG